MALVFIGGTDTGVGKTWVTVQLLQALRRQGVDAVGFKPVAAGCENTPEGLRNDDAMALMQAGAPGQRYEDINPYALPEAIAPHIAAKNCGLSIDGDRIIAGAEALAARHELVLVEGAGGLCVPLNEDEDFLQLVARAGWPTLLVIGMRLGCLNHAQLSARALQQQSLAWGWTANRLPPGQACLEENHQCLRRGLPGPELDWLSADPGSAFLEWLQKLKLAGNRRFD